MVNDFLMKVFLRKRKSKNLACQIVARSSDCDDAGRVRKERRVEMQMGRTKRCCGVEEGSG